MSRLDPRLLLQGYANGIFPMADSRDAEDLFWVEPRQRAVIPLPKFHMSRSLRKVIRSGRFTVTRDRAFADVIAACAEREETWINAELEAAMIALHGSGHAHSIEVWEGDSPEAELVGGLYGVKLGRAWRGRRRSAGRSRRAAGRRIVARSRRPARLRGARPVARSDRSCGSRRTRGICHRAALGPDVVDRVLEHVQRRRLLVEPA